MSNESRSELPDRLGPALFAVRVMMFIVALVAAPFAVWLWGIHLVSPKWSLASTLAAVTTAWVIATMALLVIRPVAKWPAAALAAWAVFASVAFAKSGQRSVCGAHAIKMASEVRSIAQHGANEIAANGQLPASFAVFLAERGELDRWQPRPCLCDSLTNVKIGRFTLQDYADGRVTLDELRTEASANPPGELEHLGRITIWRNPDAWKHGLIVVWRVPDDPRWDWLNAGSAELGVRNFDFMDDEEIAFEIDRAAKVGVTYPTELLDLIKNRQRR